MSSNQINYPFTPMPKMARLNKPVVVTEKIDGTNACIDIQLVLADQQELVVDETMLVIATTPEGDRHVLRAGSKNRFLTVKNDNFGFAAWALDNAQQLLELGVGVHRGEWGGNGIQRGYGLPQGDRRFSLFNVGRWVDRRDWAAGRMVLGAVQERAPECCHVVPVVGSGVGLEDIMDGLAMLKENGSVAAPGFMEPEGLVAFHIAAQIMFKVTIEQDGGKWQDEETKI